jgi:hypothetical protein
MSRKTSQELKIESNVSEVTFLFEYCSFVISRFQKDIVPGCSGVRLAVVVLLLNGRSLEELMPKD